MGDATDLPEFAPVRRWQAHQNFIGGLVFLDSGRILVSSSEDGKICVWNFETGEWIRTLEDHGSPVNDLAVTRDGSRLLSAGDDGKIRIWNPTDWSLEAVLKGHSGYVSGVAEAANGILISVSADKTVRFWSRQEQKLIASHGVHNDWVHDLAVSGDGKQAVTVSINQKHVVWDLSGSTPKIEREFVGAGEQDITRVLGKTVMSQPTSGMRGNRGYPTRVCWRTDQKGYVSASSDIFFWGLENERDDRCIRRSAWPIRGLQFFGDGRFLVSADHEIRVFDLQLDALIAEWSARDDKGVYSLSVHPDGKFLVSGHSNGELAVWDLEAAVRAGVPDRHFAPVLQISISPDRSTLVTSSTDGALLIRDAATMKLRHKVFLAGHPVGGVRTWLSGNNRFLLYSNSTLAEIDADSGKTLKIIRLDPEHEKQFKDWREFRFTGMTCLDSDNREFLCGSSLSGLARVNLHSGQVEFLKGLALGAMSFAVSADRKFALTPVVSQDIPLEMRATPGWKDSSMPVQLWDLERGSLIREFFSGTPRIPAGSKTDFPMEVAFSQSESRVVALANGGVLRVWDRQTGVLVRELVFEYGYQPLKLPIKMNRSLSVLAHSSGALHQFRISAESGEILQRQLIAMDFKWVGTDATGRWLIVHRQDQTTIEFHDLEEGVMVTPRIEIGHGISAHNISDDGSFIVLGDAKGRTHLYRRTQIQSP